MREDKIRIVSRCFGNLIVSGVIEADVTSDSGAAYLFRFESNGSVTELSKLSHEIQREMITLVNRLPSQRI